MKDAWVREEFCRDFGPLGNNFYFFAGSQQDVKKSQGSTKIQVSLSLSVPKKAVKAFSAF